MVKTKNQKVTKTDIRPMAQRNADAKVKAQADLAKLDFIVHLARGTSGANVNQTVTFGADVEYAIARLPKQCKLLCQYLAKCGGTATFQQLNDYADKADGVEFWGTGLTQYEQSVAKIASHYMSRLLGEKAWSNKLGKQEIIRLVA